MEINNDLEIQLFHTLEQVKRTNEAICRHQRTQEPNELMLDQFREVKARLNNELSDLLSRITETHWQLTD